MKDNKVGKSRFCIYFGGFRGECVSSNEIFWGIKDDTVGLLKNLVCELIHSTLESGTEGESPEKQRKTRQNTLHKITTAPPHSGFDGGKWVKITSKSPNSISVTLRYAQILS